MSPIPIETRTGHIGDEAACTIMVCSFFVSLVSAVCCHALDDAPNSAPFQRPRPMPQTTNKTLLKPPPQTTQEFLIRSSTAASPTYLNPSKALLRQPRDCTTLQRARGLCRRPCCASRLSCWGCRSCSACRLLAGLQRRCTPQRAGCRRWQLTAAAKSGTAAGCGCSRRSSSSAAPGAAGPDIPCGPQLAQQRGCIGAQLALRAGPRDFYCLVDGRAV